MSTFGSTIAMNVTAQLRLRSAQKKKKSLSSVYLKPHILSFFVLKFLHYEIVIKKKVEIIKTTSRSHL